MKTVKQLVLLVFMPLVLMLFWVLGSILLISNSPISVIAASHGSFVFTSFNDKEIHKGEVINAIFKAKENNLGIVAVRFNTFGRINNDSLIFSIKQRGDKSWYYTGSYKVNQFQPNDFFTFGFPIIADSRDKNYVFQMRSVKGENGDAVALSNIEPEVLTKYQFTKAQLIGNKLGLIEFAYKKIFYSFSDLSFALSSLPFLLPLLFYLLSVRYRRLIFKNRYPLFMYIFTLVLMLCLFFLQLLPGFSSFVLLSAWIFLIILNRLDSSVSFLYALLFLLIIPFMLISNQQAIAGNYAVWTYYFLAVGTVQAIYELIRKPKNGINNREFLKSFIGIRTFNFLSSKFKSLKRSLKIS